LEDIDQNKEPFGMYFEPLQNSERTKILAFQKGKIKRNRLRYYAIKIDLNCFAITGGAIKMSQTMQDHPDTDNELKKLANARAYLNKNGVLNEDSFFELLIELQ
jgi:Holliday junction resolvase RusA-like endonuclease